MEKKIAVVTGASGGLGSELCKMIAAQDIGLVFVDRSPQKSKEFAAELNRLHPGAVLGTFAVDLASHADIKRLSAEIMANHPKIDYLFNNAGVLTDSLQFSSHKNEMHFEVNTLAPLQLIDALRPALKKSGGAMVVSTSAGLSSGAKELIWDDLLCPAVFKKLFGSYAKSKQALNVITAALADELAADGITIRAADPGPNKSKLTRGAGTPLWMRVFYLLLPSPEKGARKIFNAAFSTKWGNQTGIFVVGQKIQPFPPALADPRIQAEFLRKCRERASIVS